MAEDEKFGGSANTVDTARADRPVWLMKCPPVVAQAWKQCTEAGQPLAKVILSVDPLQTEESNALQVTMELAANDFSNVPKSYSLNMSKDIVPMCIFSETSQGKMSIDGKVEHKFDMKPNNQNIDDYRKLCRERTNKSMVKNRQVQVLENDRGGYTPMQGIDFSAINSRDKKKTVAPLKGQEMKRTRRDRGEMEDIMFKLFEQQPNWTLKQLMQETDQPAQYLKDLLSELCIYNKKGTNQGTYELKPEYKKTAEDMEAE